MTTSHSIAPAPIHSRNALLRNKIIAHLPIIDQKTRMRELKDVLQEATARGNTSSAGFMQLASDYAAQSKARLARLESLRATHAKATTPDQRKEVIAEALRSEQAPRRAFAAVKRGWLDLDAMVERTEFDRHALAVRQSLALRAAAALSEERADRETVSALLEHLRGLLHELDPHSTMCAMACAEALTELLGRIAEWPETLDYDERWEILCGRALQPTLPRRVRAAQARLCLEATPSLAEPVSIVTATAELSRSFGSKRMSARQRAKRPSSRDELPEPSSMAAPRRRRTRSGQRRRSRRPRRPRRWRRRWQWRRCWRGGTRGTSRPRGRHRRQMRTRRLRCTSRSSPGTGSQWGGMCGAGRWRFG